MYGMCVMQQQQHNIVIECEMIEFCSVRMCLRTYACLVFICRKQNLANNSIYWDVMQIISAIGMICIKWRKKQNKTKRCLRCLPQTVHSTNIWQLHLLFTLYVSECVRGLRMSNNKLMMKIDANELKVELCIYDTPRHTHTGCCCCVSNFQTQSEIERSLHDGIYLQLSICLFNDHSNYQSKPIFLLFRFCYTFYFYLFIYLSMSIEQFDTLIIIFDKTRAASLFIYFYFFSFVI